MASVIEEGGMRLWIASLVRISTNSSPGEPLNAPKIPNRNTIKTIQSLGKYANQAGGLYLVYD
jgi:hypothetical protein